MLLRLVSLLFLAFFAEAAITMPRFIKSNMVLQQAPQAAQLWGWTDDAATPLTVLTTCQSGFADIADGTVSDGHFQAVIGPVPEGEICSIDIAQGDVIVSLTNVLFGDVYVCSGQSNMEWGMGSIFNAAEEIAASAEFTNIRLYSFRYMTSETEQEDLPWDYWDAWTDASNADRLGSFSAVCFLYARTISQRIGKKPFGLIDNAWGGTRIEPWMPPEGLTTCNVPPNIDTAAPYNSNSNLYNALIHPLIKMSIKGALWYQGESNSGWNLEFYTCTFAEMINTWRQRWAQNSPTSGDFPFGFVQLATNDPAATWYSFPLVRWHQTADFGYVPNDVLTNVFMAVALDTHDAESGIHPRNKQVVGDRLATSGLNVAYGLTEFPSNGPFFTAVNFVTGAESYAQVIYDQDFTYNPVENSGFYICSTAGGPDICDYTAGSYQLISSTDVNQVAPNELRIALPISPAVTALAYLWKESPLLVPSDAAPIYGSDQYRLPAAPWKHAA